MKHFISIIFACISCVAVAAQECVPHKFAISPMAGITIADMTDMIGENQRVGFVGGVEAEARLNGRMALSGGILYSQQGMKAKTASVDGAIYMDYITVPLLFNFYPVKGLAVKGGLEPGILVNDKEIVKVDGKNYGVDLDDQMSKSTGSAASSKSFILSFPIGVSYEYKNFVIDVRYKIPLSTALALSTKDSKHKVFQLTLGYRFGFK